MPPHLLGRYEALAFRGGSIAVRFGDELTAWRGKLLSGDDRGQAVLAGSFLRHREIVLDRELLADKRELMRILVHEVFHFVWARLGNGTRHDWERLLRAELRDKTSGEAGWSAEWRKAELRPRDLGGRTRRWREYVCESFCDTAAWLCTGRHDEFTLQQRELAARRRWFARLLQHRSNILPI